MRSAELVEREGASASRREWEGAVEGLLSVVRRWPESPQAKRGLRQAISLARQRYEISGDDRDRRAHLELLALADRLDISLEPAKKGKEARPPSDEPLSDRKDGDQAPQSGHRDAKSGDPDGFAFDGPPLRGYALTKNGADSISPGATSPGATSPGATQPSGGREKLKGPSSMTSAGCWQSAGRGRVVLRFTKPVRPSHGVLQPRAGQSFGRLYLDFPGTETVRSVRRTLRSCVGPAIKRSRVGKRPDGSLRVVFEIATPARFHVYPLHEPYRLIVDVTKKGAVARSLSNIRVIAIDAGHGGASQGAVGPTGLEEKEVVLDIAKRVEKGLEARGLETVMTRTRDKDVELEERTAAALAAGADLFISIHANAEPTGQRQAVETYYLDTGSNEFDERLAQRENEMSGRPAKRDRILLAKLVTKRITKRSAQLAHAIHAHLLSAVRTLLPSTEDGHVKKNVFYVLLTARVPGVLVEVSHISNPKGEKLLKRKGARARMASAIVKGVMEYVARNRARMEIRGSSGTTGRSPSTAGTTGQSPSTARPRPLPSTARPRPLPSTARPGATEGEDGDERAEEGDSETRKLYIRVRNKRRPRR
jgi:N-acetylmuramoyl-L-alanine amidase